MLINSVIFLVKFQTSWFQKLKEVKFMSMWKIAVKSSIGNLSLFLNHFLVKVINWESKLSVVSHIEVHALVSEV